MLNLKQLGGSSLGFKMQDASEKFNFELVDSVAQLLDDVVRNEDKVPVLLIPGDWPEQV